jgi:hypothetical protein
VRNHKRIIISIFVLLLLSGIVFYSPQFLLYSTDYKKTDAIIILLGPDFKARKKGANELINKGTADYLIIPAYHKAYRLSNKDHFLLSDINLPESVKSNNQSYPSFYEDTHVEIIEAQRIMSYYGLKSAIFVSSPHHMRRIKIIARKVFKTDKYIFYFVPTRYENIPVKFWELSYSDWRKIRREYSKIIWFFMYFTWSEYVDFD